MKQSGLCGEDGKPLTPGQVKIVADELVRWLLILDPIIDPLPLSIFTEDELIILLDAAEIIEKARRKREA